MNGRHNLGITLLRLNNFNEVEDALTQANIFYT